jgi:hypothetical protein
MLCVCVVICTISLWVQVDKPMSFLLFSPWFLGLHTLQISFFFFIQEREGRAEKQSIHIDLHSIIKPDREMRNALARPPQSSTQQFKLPPFSPLHRPSTLAWHNNMYAYMFLFDVVPKVKTSGQLCCAHDGAEKYRQTTLRVVLHTLNENVSTFFFICCWAVLCVSNYWLTEAGRRISLCQKAIGGWGGGGWYTPTFSGRV